MNVDDLYGTLYVPKDGTMDPAGTCTTLTRAATARGATVMSTDLLNASLVDGQLYSVSTHRFQSVCVCVCVSFDLACLYIVNSPTTTLHS